MINLLWSVVALGVFSNSVAAQSISSTRSASVIRPDTNQLQQLVDLLTNDRLNQRQLALEKAALLGLPIQQELSTGGFVLLDRFVQGRPQYYITTNAVAADTLSTDEVWSGGSLQLDLSGAGQTLGIWDGGNVRASHQELAGSVINLDTAPVHYHATHVAGTLIAKGINSLAKGMSWGAQLRAHDFNNDTSEMASEQLLTDPLVVSNHSYSYIGGWISNFFGDGLPVWFGDVAISTTEDWNFGFYDGSSRDWDQIAHNSPYYTIVKSAGNDRNDNGSGVHWHYDGNIGDFVQATDSHPKDGGSSGFDTIAAGSASAKNVITVGAVQDIPGGYNSPADVSLASFSGWGPTDDGRIKPDIVANGIGLTSSLSATDTQYGVLSGTSMASPNAAGSIALLYELANDLFGAPLLAATVKSLIVHSADESGAADGPDYQSGWGLMNTAKAAQIMLDEASAGATGHIFEFALQQGETRTFSVSSDGSLPLKATIAWTDLPATPSTPGVDPGTLKLVNDLDLRVTAPDAKVHQPWILDPANPTAAATQGDNFRDPVEQVLIPTPTPGNYTVSISHKNALSGGSQQVSLVITGNEDGTVVSPEFNSIPALNARVGVAYVYDADSRAEATGTQPISFSLGFGPVGFTVDSEGLVSWTPAVDQVGNHLVQLVASNVAGSTTQEFQINVTEPALGAINLNNYTVSSYGGSQDGAGTVDISSDGSSITLIGNRWQSININYTITSSTILEFDFESDTEGEIHGIGFDNNTSISSNLTFQLFGTQLWGIQNFATYSSGAGVQSYKIPVGQFYTGSYAYLFFAMDHDVLSPSGHSKFSNIRLYEDSGSAAPPVITSVANTSATVNQPYSYDADNQLSADGDPAPSFFLVSGPANMTVTSAGIVSWTPLSSQEGEQTITITATNSEGSDTQTFTVTVAAEPGTAPAIISVPNTHALVGQPYSYDANDQLEADGDPAPSFSLISGPANMTVTTAGMVSWTPLASQEGEQTITIAATNSEGVDTQTFTVVVAAASGDIINFNDYVVGAFGGSQDGVGEVTVEDNGLTLRLSGNRWQQIPLSYNVTADTVLEFTFSSSQLGDIHAIGLHNSLMYSSSRTFQLSGTQTWGVQNFNNYVSGSAPVLYRIPVGQFYTGAMNYLFFVMDHDVPTPTGESIFSSVRVYEDSQIPVAPAFISTANTVATVGIPYLYDSDSRAEADGYPTPVFSLVSGPQNFNVAADGTITWTPDAGDEGTQFIEIGASNAVGSAIQQFSITVEPSASDDFIDFITNPPGAYGGSQDGTGNVSVENGGTAMRMTGNRWQQITVDYTITANTVVEFDFSSSAEGEIQGLGFDDNLVYSSNRTFQLYGRDNWGNQTYHNYPGNGTQHYVIPVGQFYSGFFPYLFFIMDDDSGAGTGESLFSNIKLYDN